MNSEAFSLHIIKSNSRLISLSLCAASINENSLSDFAKSSLTIIAFTCAKVSRLAMDILEISLAVIKSFEDNVIILVAGSST